jgi:hypothetical protein
MDYYSNHISGNRWNGISDVEWGKKQADLAWSLLKDDMEGILFIDIESTNGNYAPKIDTVWDRAMVIMGSFLSRFDQLSGKTNGIYASLGALSNFYSKFRSRPLWVAWYPYRTVNNLNEQNIISEVKKTGWKVKPLIWQYASDGDLDDNGTSDGKSMGMEYTFLDLNGVIDIPAFESIYSGIPVIDDPVVIPEHSRTIPVKTTVRACTLRNKPYVSITTWMRSIPTGMSLDCLEEIKDGKDIWQRVGLDQYVADFVGGIKFLE